MNKFLKDVEFYYINLNKDTDKNQYMINHLLENGVENINRIEAVDGKSENIIIKDLSFSESGCVLSHIKAIKNFYHKSKSDYAIICEDDLDIDNIKKISFSFYSTLEVYNPELYCLQLVSSTREDIEISFSLRPRTFWDFSTVAYIINKKYAKLLLDRYSTALEIEKNFVSNIYVDYRGGQIKTRPVADELVYSLRTTYIFPIFTLKPFESSISSDKERHRQVLHSIKLFDDEWSNYDSINIERFFL
jgi:GR25 family glycosyltransferase involved in LPS biosynthesis